MKLKKVAILIVASIFAVYIAACESGGNVLLKYDDCISMTDEYYTDMFFQNDLALNHAADPGAIWVSEEQDAENGGYFYVYATTLYNNFIGARSKDLNSWESLGPVIDWSLSSTDIWSVTDMWAPEVIYYQTDAQKAAGEKGKYYLFYSGSRANAVDTDECYLGVAVSDSPSGPFAYYEGTNVLGETLTAANPTIDFNIDHRNGNSDGSDYLSKVRPSEYSNEFNPSRNNSTIKNKNTVYIIDASPYIDDDGSIYLYLRTQYSYESSDKNLPQLSVVKMRDMITPMYDTLTNLTYPGYKSLADKENGIVWDKDVDRAATYDLRLNEAPFMIKHNGVYYLTYAPYYYGNRVGYSVSVAVSNNPNGPFVKMDYDNGNPVLYVDDYMDHMAGTGHHCFVKAGDELFVFYHSLMNRETGNSNPRGIAYDRITFVDGNLFNIDAEEYGIISESGTFDMLYANGPTWSLQSLPAVSSSYINIASLAKVSATNAEQSTVQYINDGLFVTHEYADFMEFVSKGKTEITLQFDTPQELNAIMIYNSYDYNYAFSCIDEIEFELSETPSSLLGIKSTKVYIKNLGINPNYYNDSKMITRPGGAAIARFDMIKVKKIKITISKSLQTIEDMGGIIRVSDIVLLSPKA